jgi:hypothetical protein
VHINLANPGVTSGCVTLGTIIVAAHLRPLVEEEQRQVARTAPAAASWRLLPFVVALAYGMLVVLSATSVSLLGFIGAPGLWGGKGIGHVYLVWGIGGTDQTMTRATPALLTPGGKAVLAIWTALMIASPTVVQAHRPPLHHPRRGRRVFLGLSAGVAGVAAVPLASFANGSAPGTRGSSVMTGQRGSAVSPGHRRHPARLAWAGEWRETIARWFLAALAGSIALSTVAAPVARAGRALAWFVRGQRSPAPAEDDGRRGRARRGHPSIRRRVRRAGARRRGRRQRPPRRDPRAASPKRLPSYEWPARDVPALCRRHPRAQGRPRPRRPPLSPRASTTPTSARSPAPLPTSRLLTLLPQVNTPTTTPTRP